MRKGQWRALVAATVALLFVSGIQGVAQAEEKEKAARVVVPRIQVSGVKATDAELLTDVLLDVLFNRHGITALGPSEIQQMLSVEAQKQLLGCSDSDCLAEIGGALEARYLISGRIGKLGTQNMLTLLLIDTQKSELAGRATVKLAQIEDAIDAMGPLTDKLLGRTFRAARASEIAAFRDREETRPDYEPMTKRDFCKKYDRYRETLEKKPYDEAHPKTREALLFDVILTPHKPRYDEKVSCIRRSAGYMAPRIVSVLRGLDTPEAALDARQRYAEARKFTDQLQVVEGAYAMGLEKVKLNTGDLPVKLPFKVKPAKIVLPEESEEVAEYQRVYAHGQKLIARALAAVKAGTLPKFEKLFGPLKKGRSRNLKSTFESLASTAKGGYRLDPCPFFVLSIDGVEENAKLLAEKGQLKACFRKRNDKGSHYLRDVTLEKVEGKWRIDRW